MRKRSARGARVGALVVVGVLATAHAAGAQGDLSLTISSPRIEESPMTFGAAGVARGADSNGDSMDYLQGAVLPRKLPCPAGPDEFGKIPGSVLDTFNAFPVGSFNITYQFNPGNGDLLAGDYRECGYLVDRETSTTRVSSQQEFTVRKPGVGVQVLNMPRHVKFFYDTIGRPTANLTFLVRASAEVSGRKLLLGFRRTGRPCGGNPDSVDYGGQDQPLSVKPGRARTYRLHPALIMHPGPFPYGRRVRICAVVAYYENSHDRYLPEGQGQAIMRIRR